MHADKREEIDTAEAGDIVAIMGIDCASGDTFCSEPNYCTLENIFVAKPVIKMAIQPIVARQRRPAGQGPAAIPQRRPDLPGDDRRRDGRDGDRRHGRIAPGDLRRANSPRVPRRSRGRAPKVSYRESRHQGGCLRFQAQEADRRHGPVRPHRRPDQPDDRRGSGRDRRRADVRRQRRRAAAFRRTIFPRSKRASATCWPRARWPASRSWA